MQARDAPPTLDQGAPTRLRKRSQFLRVAGGRKAHVALFTLQMRRRDDDPGPARVGLTVTKKVGGAVERNRIRRRLRETLRAGVDLTFPPQHDIVIVARRELLWVPFPVIATSLAAAVAKAQGKPAGGARRARS